VITGLAHTAVCVPDVDAAVAWHEEVLGLQFLSSPPRMEDDAISRHMGELVPAPPLSEAARAVFGVRFRRPDRGDVGVGRWH